MKHDVRVHVVNLYTEEIGNPESTTKPEAGGRPEADRESEDASTFAETSYDDLRLLHGPGDEFAFRSACSCALSGLGA